MGQASRAVQQVEPRPFFEAIANGRASTKIYESGQITGENRLRQTLMWIDEMQLLLATTDPEKVVHCDETAWHVIPPGLPTSGKLEMIRMTSSCLMSKLWSLISGWSKIDVSLTGKQIRSRPSIERKSYQVR
jgi:hypothetical protein